MNNKQSKFEVLALRFTKWIGSTSSIIVHTLVFIMSFVFVLLGVSLEKVLLVLTTAVSLEAIYLAIFIQLTVNNQAESLKGVEEDIDEIQEDIDEIQEDVDEIQEDVDEIQEDVDEIQEDVGEMSAPEDLHQEQVTLSTIYADLKKLMEDVEKFKQNQKDS